MTEPTEIMLGDLVEYEMDGTSGQGIVIGCPHYSSGYGNVVMIADWHAIGCPFNVKWLKIIDRGHPFANLRSRFDLAHPGFLKEEPK